MFGRFTYTLSALNGHHLLDFWYVSDVVVMSVHIIQSVREQPDTRYWKCLTAYFAADPGCGGVRLSAYSVLDRLNGSWESALA